MSNPLEGNEREPMDRCSQFSGSRLFKLKARSFYHTDVRRGRVVLCGCGRFIKHSDKWSPLGPRRKRHIRWGYKRWGQTIWG